MDVDPNNPNVVYVGTPQNGLFVTTDGGTTWQSVSAVPVSQTMVAASIPASPGSYSIGSWYDGRKDQYHLCFKLCNGVYESTNGGTSWSHLNGVRAALNMPPFRAPASLCGQRRRYVGLELRERHMEELIANYYNLVSVAVDPFNANHLLVEANNGYVDQSFDGGSTWSLMAPNTSLSATDVSLAGESGFMAVLARYLIRSFRTSYGLPMVSASGIRTSRHKTSTIARRLFP